MVSMLSDYSEFMLRCADFTEKSEEREDGDLNDAGMKYCIRIRLRAEEKLPDVLK